MEDLTLALVTVGTFVFLFIVAIFADKAGTEIEVPIPVRVESDPQRDPGVAPRNLDI